MVLPFKVIKQQSMTLFNWWCMFNTMSSTHISPDSLSLPDIKHKYCYTNTLHDNLWGSAFTSDNISSGLSIPKYLWTTFSIVGPSLHHPCFLSCELHNIFNLIHIKASITCPNGPKDNCQQSTLYRYINPKLIWHFIMQKHHWQKMIALKTYTCV